MKETNFNQPSESELEILQVLWEHPAATVRLVHEQVNARRGAEKEVGYTTVLKQLQRMTDKGVVVRTKAGKTHLYSAVLKEKEVQDGVYKRMVDTVYKGSAMNLVMHALGQSKTTPEELDALQKWIEEQQNKNNG